MAIQIGGTTVIDNSRNITNVGIITVGTGGTSGTLKVGTGTTIDGAGNAYFNGNLTINGKFFVGGGSISTTGLTAFYPQEDDLTQFDVWVGIVTMTFTRNVGIATTSSPFQIRKTSVDGNLVTQTGISSVNYKDGNLKIINVFFPRGGITTSSTTIFRYFPIIPSNAIYFTDNSQYYPGVNSGAPGDDEYSFNFRAANLGELGLERGGYLICQSGGTTWVVSPAEVSRNWYSRDDANTTAQSVSGCTGWFVPTRSQLQNPGYLCRSFWGPYSPTIYWSSTSGSGAPNTACTVSFTGSHAPYKNMGNTYCIRAFRCVTY